MCFKTLFRSLFLLLIVFSVFEINAKEQGVKKVLDIKYGEHKRNTLDVYYPYFELENAPVIFMVHGGAWRTGDKGSKAVVDNKVAHWVSKGFIFVSVNYRLVPSARPIEQAEDVKNALLFTKRRVAKLGGSADKIILMGHSAGAHLVSLVSTRHYDEISPWLGTIALDSAAYDVEKIMNQSRKPRFYKKAFGKDPVYWKEASPIHTLSNTLPPFLAVCSTKRKDGACVQAQGFVEKAKAYQTQTYVLPEALSHRAINLELGKPNCYTQRVDEFIRRLHPTTDSILRDSSLDNRCKE